jgi:L-lactate dehydrogenase complex protein LldG
MSARDEILSGLRKTLDQPNLRFPPANTSPLDLDRMTVTEALGGPYELAFRFGQELVALHGSYEIVESTAEARLSLLNRIGAWIEAEEAAQKGAVIKTGQERSILAWNPELLPVDGLAVALEDMHLLLVNPDNLDSEQAREDIRFIRYGVTGVDAAFASTGSMLMISGPGKSRVASLLPFYHVALIPFTRLYPTVESWLAKQRDDGALIQAMSEQANISMITGPSKSADIEMNLTLGVHGPKFLHAILFDDENDAGGLGFEAESEFDSLRFDNQFGFEEA